MRKASIGRYAAPMLYVLGGASGAGKTTLVPHLNRLRPTVRWHDFDSRWRWHGGTHRERQQLTQEWIEAALGHDGDFGLAGACPLGELLAAPSFSQLPGLRHLLLDIGDVERIGRLRRRGDGCDTQEILNWAAWLRVHEVMPDWRPDVLMQGGWEEMRWDRWVGRPEVPWPGQALDVSGLSPEAAARRVLDTFDAAPVLSPPP